MDTIYSSCVYMYIKHPFTYLIMEEKISCFTCIQLYNCQEDKDLPEEILCFLQLTKGHRMAEPGCSIISFAMQNWYFKLILAIETLSGDRFSNVLQVLILQQI